MVKEYHTTRRYEPSSVRTWSPHNSWLDPSYLELYKRPRVHSRVSMKRLWSYYSDSISHVWISFGKTWISSLPRWWYKRRCTLHSYSRTRKPFQYRRSICSQFLEYPTCYAIYALRRSSTPMADREREQKQEQEYIYDDHTSVGRLWSLYDYSTRPWWMRQNVLQQNSIQMHPWNFVWKTERATRAQVTTPFSWDWNGQLSIPQRPLRLRINAHVRIGYIRVYSPPGHAYPPECICIPLANHSPKEVFLYASPKQHNGKISYHPHPGISLPVLFLDPATQRYTDETDMRSISRKGESQLQRTKPSAVTTFT
jgi:hypothetical protein